MDKDRNLAYNILLSVMKDGMYSNLAISKAFKDQAPNSSDFVRRLVYGTIEKSIYLDYHLDMLLSKGVKSTDEELIILLRMGLYQLEFMHSVPDYAAISSCVELAKKHLKGRDKLVNGVLRNWQRKKDDISLPPMDEEAEYLSIKYSCHIGIVELLLNEYGLNKAERILSAEPKSGRITFRTNILKNSVHDLRSKLMEEGVGTELSDISERIVIPLGEELNILESPSYLEGCYSVQTEGSCWIADNTGVKAGYRVLDLCAAPGGKTLAMAETMNNEGEIIATDIYSHRLSVLEKNASRLGIDIIKTYTLDARKPLPDEIAGGLFDVVLVDAPCSGIGVINTKPDLKLKCPDIDSLVKIQEAILINGGNYVRPGGLLIYSTCTIIDRENGNIVRRFLDDYQFTLLKEDTLLPDENPRCDGFYLAVMKKGDHPDGCGV